MTKLFQEHALLLALLALTAAFATPSALADTVVPSDDVVNAVVVRQGPSAQTAPIASLRPGDVLTLIGSVPGWHRVQVTDSTVGFVSKRWTRVVAMAASPAAPIPTYLVEVVDVGTGLAVLVRASDFTLVYDAGSNDDLALGQDNRMPAYIQAVAPAMTKIDHIILSHPHRDHVELLPDLFRSFEVREVWDSGRVNDICGYQAFLTAIRDEPGVKYHNALQDFGTSSVSFESKTCYGSARPQEAILLPLSSRISDAPIPLGAGAFMTILHADGGDHPSANENSLVVKLTLGSTNILLMGDAEAGGRKDPSSTPSDSSIEGELLACCKAQLASRILIAGHHGSKTSSRTAFIDAVGASISVISAGPTKYGSVVLPDAAVVAELTTRGQVFRTDRADGACATNSDKIGPDADGKAGGCDNVRFTISDVAPLGVGVWNGRNN